MQIIRTVTALAAAGALFAGCSSEAVGRPVVVVGAEATTTTRPISSTTTTTTAAALTTTTTASPYVREVESENGWRYRIAVAAPVADPSSSYGGCVKVAQPGKTNLHYAVAIENLQADRPAPWPYLRAQLNLNESGTASVRPDRYGMFPFRGVTIAPNASDSPCFLNFSLSTSRFRPETIPAGSTSTFVITAGPVAGSLPPGTILTVTLPGDSTFSIPTDL